MLSDVAWRAVRTAAATRGGVQGKVLFMSRATLAKIMMERRTPIPYPRAPDSGRHRLYGVPVHFDDLLPLGAARLEKL